MQEKGQRGLEDKGPNNVSTHKIQAHRVMVGMGKTWFTGREERWWEWRNKTERKRILKQRQNDTIGSVDSSPADLTSLLSTRRSSPTTRGSRPILKLLGLWYEYSRIPCAIYVPYFYWRWTASILFLARVSVQICPPRLPPCALRFSFWTDIYAPELCGDAMLLPIGHIRGRQKSAANSTSTSCMLQFTFFMCTGSLFSPTFGFYIS
jgi:hypothetical protein